MTRYALPIHQALRDVERWGEDGYTARFAHLRFLVTVSPQDDGKAWLHASVSRRDKQTPTWEDLGKLKHYVLGDDRYAYFVLPPIDKYVNLGPVLHLFHCLDAGDRGMVLPEFSGVIEGVRTI